MMIFKKVKYSAFILLFTVLTTDLFAQNSEEDNIAVLNNVIETLRRYFTEDAYWYVTDSLVAENMNSLINFIQNEPVDTVLSRLNKYLKEPGFLFLTRLPENVADSLSIPGYYSNDRLNTDIQRINDELTAKYKDTQADSINIDEIPGIIKFGDGMKLFIDSIYIFPDSLIIPEVIPDTLLEDAESFTRLLNKDSLRAEYVEQKRLAYNDSIVKVFRESNQNMQNSFEEEYRQQVKQLTDSVKLNNYSILKLHNDAAITAINDTIYSALTVLYDYANYIDSTKINIVNIAGDSYSLMLNTQDSNFNRVWLKNEQNDSLGVLVKNLDKRTIQMLIDDGVVISRFRRRGTRQFDFSSLNNNTVNLFDVGKRYVVETPWQLRLNTNVGFTQTHISENWQKGGQSALSLLFILKGTANYSRADGKIKWENSSEIRNGYIQPGGENSELQKNDDKLELTSRFGVNAFKKWYYSAELNFETQFFRGYKYPTSTYPDPISSFMAPAKTFIKLGLDYKPNKDFSLLLSPVTVKNIFVKDTMLIDQTKFGIGEGEKSFWEPGLNADVTFNKEIVKNIIYTTKYKMFINYKDPLQKFDINWENQVNLKLTNYINMQMMLHMIYDDDVLFPVYDKNGDPTGVEKPKLQLKQLVTVGFTYNISRNIMRTRRIG
ncbi:MAG: DUF3078 domain-containing protein [Bacteroidales bacterium]|jgi:hypothetical protein|nr:DUF3078 domain-containing protein [Bacteroidales bacterium]